MTGSPRDILIIQTQHALEGAKDESAQIAIYDGAAFLAKALNCPELETLCRDLADTLRSIVAQQEVVEVRQLQFIALIRTKPDEQTGSGKDETK